MASAIKGRVLIREEFDKYLIRVGLVKSELPKEQLREMESTFFGAWGQFWIILSKDIAELDEGQGYEVVMDMRQQVLDYFGGVE